MSDFEKACRYICFAKTDDEKAKSNRYEIIENMIHGDEDLIKKYSKKYEKMIDILSF